MSALGDSMDERLQPLRSWYAGLDSREQRIVLWGGLFTAILLFIGAGVLPLYTAVGKTAQRVEQKQQDLEWMRGVAGAVRAAGPATATAGEGGSGSSLIVAVDQSARQAGLGNALTGSQPSGSGGLRVRLENASFDTVIGWLAAMEQGHGIAVESAGVNRTGKAGVINADIVLRKTG